MVLPPELTSLRSLEYLREPSALVELPGRREEKEIMFTEFWVCPPAEAKLPGASSEGTDLSTRT